jgi:hypothetical protein
VALTFEVKHHPRCAIWRDPPSLRDDTDCNCGAIPQLPDPQEKEVRRHHLATIIRDFLDEKGYGDCGPGADTCPNWEPAYELADKILAWQSQSSSA